MEPRKATIIDMARQLKVSKSTVSRALSGHRSIGLRTRMRVEQLAKEWNYEPNQTAIFFKQRRTYLIGVILPSLSNSFFSSIITFDGKQSRRKESDQTISYPLKIDPRNCPIGTIEG